MESSVVRWKCERSRHRTAESSPPGRFWFNIIRFCTEPLSGMPATVSFPVCIVWRILHICPPLRSNEFLCRSAVPLPLPFSPFSCHRATVNFMLGVIRIGRTRRRIQCTHVFTCAAFLSTSIYTLTFHTGERVKIAVLVFRTKN